MLTSRCNSFCASSVRSATGALFASCCCFSPSLPYRSFSRAWTWPQRLPFLDLQFCLAPDNLTLRAADHSVLVEAIVPNLQSVRGGTAGFIRDSHLTRACAHCEYPAEPQPDGPSYTTLGSDVCNGIGSRNNGSWPPEKQLGKCKSHLERFAFVLRASMPYHDSHEALFA